MSEPGGPDRLRIESREQLRDLLYSVISDAVLNASFNKPVAINAGRIVDADFSALSVPDARPQAADEALESMKAMVLDNNAGSMKVLMSKCRDGHDWLVIVALDGEAHELAGIYDATTDGYGSPAPASEAKP